MDLLERSSALDELGGLLAAAAAGGRVVLVAGEAGIGKSALVRGFAERHAADVRFLAGGCDPLLTPRVLGPLHDIARQTAAGWPSCSPRGATGGGLRCVPG
jgi:predicted ATPase